MAKFCGNCGAQLDEDARVCGQCGTPIDGAQIKISGLNIVDFEKKKKTKEKIKLVVIWAIIAAVAFSAFNVVYNFTGNRGLVRKVMTAYEEYDIDTLVWLSSDMYFYGGEDTVESYFEYSVGSDLDDFESSVGHSYNLTYEVNEIYDLSERKQDEMLDNIEYLYPDFDISEIDKISVADITVTVKQGNKSVNRDVKITMSKEGKEWRLLYIE